MITRDDVVLEARLWLGTPFRHQASLFGVGCDCIGLVVGVMSMLKLPEAQGIKTDARFHGYGRLPDGESLRQGCADYADEVALSEVRPGDVVLFTFANDPMHLGIISQVDPQYMIHSYQPSGRVVENRVDVKWQRRAVAAYRLRGIE